MKVASLSIAVLVCVFAAAARADDPPAPPPPVDDPATIHAREEFVEGAARVKRGQWSEALESFQRSLALRSHAVTVFNIGTCERAIGRYARARKTFLAALAMNDAAGGSELSALLAGDAKTYIAEAEQLLARMTIKLTPANAAIAVDGRPLELLDAKAAHPALVAGVREPGPGEPPPQASFDLLLDPGAHVLTFSRKGYANAVINKTFAPSATLTQDLVLDLLPATLRITSNTLSPIVIVNGIDVGAAPVDVARPGGVYDVIVKKKGFVTFEQRVKVQSGEDVNLRAVLPVEKASLTSRWWFWGSLVAGASTIAIVSVVATRPAPTRTPCNPGGLGWCLQTP